MVSKAKRKARAEAAAAEEAAADRGGPSSGEESSDSEGEAAAVRPSKRIKGAAGGGAAAAAPGGAAAAADGWRNKEKPLVLCSRGIPGRCVAAAAAPARHATRRTRHPSASARVHTRHLAALLLPGAFWRSGAAWRLAAPDETTLFHSCVSNERGLPRPDNTNLLSEATERWAGPCARCAALREASPGGGLGLISARGPACAHAPAPAARSFRHLMLDIVQLLPHCKKDVKLDTKARSSSHVLLMAALSHTCACRTSGM
jgi:hypothetical protein